MASPVRLVRFVRYQWPGLLAFGLAYVLVSAERLSWPQALTGLGVWWLGCQLWWMVGRYRALRKADRLSWPVWEVRILRGVRAAIAVMHDEVDVASIVGYRSMVRAYLLTVWQWITHILTIVGTLVQHRVITWWRVRQARAGWDNALSSKKVAIVQGREKRVPFLSDPHTTIDLDVEAWVKPTRLGYVVQDIADVAVRIAEVVGCKSMAVRPGAKTGVGLLHFYWTDPLDRYLSIDDLPPSPKANRKGLSPIVYGVRQSGKAAFFDPNLPILVAGETGSGKSCLMWTCLVGLIRAGIPTEIYAVDPKGGMELRELWKQIGKSNPLINVRRYTDDPSDKGAGKLFAEAATRLRKRQEYCRDHDIRAHIPTVEEPLLLVWVDELIDVVDTINKTGKAASPFGLLCKNGRAGGAMVWCCTQVGHADTLGVIRNLIPQRACLAMRSADAMATVLGRDAEARGARCHALVPNVDAGLGWSVDESGRLEKFRAAHINDELVRDGENDIQRIASGRLPWGMEFGVEKPQPLTVGEAERVAVYRVYGPADGKARPLWYIGISNAPGLRFDQHRDRDVTRGECRICGEPRCRWWATHVDPYRGDPTRCPEPKWYPDRKTALKVERAAIKAEAPLMNKVHNRGNPWARRTKAKVTGGKARRFATRRAVAGPEESRRVTVAASPRKRWRAVQRPVEGNPLSPVTAQEPECPLLPDRSLEDMSIAERNALLDGVGHGAE